MLRKSLIFLIFSYCICLSYKNAEFEIPKDFLKLPDSLSNSLIILDRGLFKALRDDSTSYNFKIENLDPCLRYANRNNLFFKLGMMWQFDDECLMIASDILDPDSLDGNGHDFKIYSDEDAMFESAMKSRPRLGYLEVYELEDGEYGIHIHQIPKPKTILSCFWTWLTNDGLDFKVPQKLTVGTAIIPPEDDSKDFDCRIFYDETQRQPGESPKDFTERREKSHALFMADINDFVFGEVKGKSAIKKNK